jgi:signal transduction histidine kinase
VARWLVHDLRNPIQALTLIPELIGESSGVDQEARDTFRHSTERLGRLLVLLDHVLRAPPADTTAAPISLHAPLGFLRAVMSLHRGAARLDPAQALEARLPAIRGVEQHLEQAMLNLLLNALEAIGAGEGTVQITAAEDGPRVIMAFEDDGPGVSPEVRGQLFESFATTRHRPLAGLGLVAARELLRRSGGTLVHTPTPRGARFEIGLPIWRR